MPSFEILLAEFTARWQRGECPCAEEYLGRISPDRPTDLVELIYREFCLAERAGLQPRKDEYLARFPGHAGALQRLFSVHEAFSSSLLRVWEEPVHFPALPEVGDSIGQYRFIRELGQGGLARVFLAEQTDLEKRLLVVKVSTRITPEARLLARASHPNIVEVFSHGLVNDGEFQMLCMPFLGGATLSEILGDRRRRGARPASGLELLEDLDRCSAREYPHPGMGRPAREMIGAQSYPRSVAWIVARLAEALDFAYLRGVLHGDIKPSNILLTADGIPMLLDFNLSVGWNPYVAGPGSREIVSEMGGTLAYMAPERLQSIADPKHATPPTVSDRHRADIYSLGVVLLELLTGRPPDLPQNRQLSVPELASAYVLSRQQGGEVMIRSTRRPLPMGMRAILAHCLAPDPADRYRSASELASDLDLWRNDRPLMFARDPKLTTGLFRWARRQRLALVIVAACVAITAATTLTSWWFGHQAEEERAKAALAQIIDGTDSDLFRERRLGSRRVKEPVDPVVASRRTLDYFKVIDGGDWRERPDVRALPAHDRAELEALILGQTLRYARGLRERPNTEVGDYQRALTALSKVIATAPYPTLLSEARTVRETLQRLGAVFIPEQPPADAVLSNWLGEYLCGVEAELDHRAADAAEHYRRVLRERPDSFWGHYRAAAVACAQSALHSATREPHAAEIANRYYEEAVSHLEICVKQRPRNAGIRRSYAGCLYVLKRYDEASAQYEIAQNLDPDHAETYLSRSFLHLDLGQLGKFEQDIRQYENLVTLRPSSSSGRPPLGIDPSVHELSENSDAPVQIREIASDADTLNAWYANALKLEKSGNSRLALDEINRVIAVDPDDLRARYLRGVILLAVNREEGDREFKKLIEHRRFESFVKRYPSLNFAYLHVSHLLIREGKAAEAVEMARKGCKYADEFKSRQLDFRFKLAEACAVAARDDVRYLDQMIEALKDANRLDEAKFKEWYENEPGSEAIRSALGPQPFSATDSQQKQQRQRSSTP